MARARLLILTGIAALACLAVLLGRRSPEPVSATQEANVLPLTLRRGRSSSLAMGPGGIAPATTVAPIPVPPGEAPWLPVEPRGVEFVETTLQGRSSSPRLFKGLGSGLLRKHAVPLERYHRVIEGESLETIAARYLGSPDRALEIFASNRDRLTNPEILPLGQQLRIPPAWNVAPEPSTSIDSK